MEVHKPKPVHGLRAFLAEVGVIVIGVLIALGAEQVVLGLHERQIAAEARRNVRAEAQLDLMFVQGRMDSGLCIDHRLDELAALLRRAGDGALDPPPLWIGHPPTSPIFEERWQAATASGRNSFFTADEQAGFDNLYGLFTRFNAHQTHEQLVWSDLRALETWDGPLGPAARLAFAQDLQQARYEAWDLKYAGAVALKAGAALGLAAPRQGSDPSSICLPIDTPRADALRRLKAQFGEP